MSEGKKLFARATKKGVHRARQRKQQQRSQQPDGDGKSRSHNSDSITCARSERDISACAFANVFLLPGSLAPLSRRAAVAFCASFDCIRNNVCRHSHRFQSKSFLMNACLPRAFPSRCPPPPPLKQTEINFDAHFSASTQSANAPIRFN